MVVKTELIQIGVSNPEDSITVLGKSNVRGRGIPIVVTPSNRWWASCYMTIPSGAQSILQRCGENYPDGPDAYKLVSAPGFNCLPFWYNVAYCVTQTAITYNAPVKSCPTADNVMVDCDLTLVFSIGCEEIVLRASKTTREQRMMPGESIRNFVYKLGVLRFNQYLSAACDEGIRQLLRSTPLSEVYELRGSNQKGIRKVMDQLNEKFFPFGVRFSKAAITDVHIGELARLLQGTTEFESKKLEQNKKHDHSMKLIHHNFEQNKTMKEQDYARRIQDCRADQNVALVYRKEQVVEMNSRKTVAEVKAKQEVDVSVRKANADFTVSTANGRKQNEQLLGQTRAEYEAAKIKIDVKCEARIAESEALIKAAQAKGTALKATAQAEDQAASQLKAIREHKLRMAKFEVEADIAGRSKLVVGGESGQRLIDSMLNKSILDDNLSLGQS